MADSSILWVPGGHSALSGIADSSFSNGCESLWRGRVAVGVGGVHTPCVLVSVTAPWPTISDQGSE